MPDVTWTHTALPSILNAIPIDMRSLVDLGCGRGIIGAICRIYREPERLVGVDYYQLYFEFAKRMNFYDECIRWDLMEIPLPFKDKEFGVVTCIEVLEHLPKQAGSRLLNELERVGLRIVLTTPTIFFNQAQYDGNIYQRHLSLWTVKDFKRRGYQVHGIGYMKMFGRTLKYISPVLGKLTKPFPSLSTVMLCVKDTVAT